MGEKDIGCGSLLTFRNFITMLKSEERFLGSMNTVLQEKRSVRDSRGNGVFRLIKKEKNDDQENS